MSDLLRSAFNYFNATPGSSLNRIGKTDHPLVGNFVEIGGLKLKIRSLIAEGGFALVFSVQDSQGNSFALKRQLAADRQAADAIIREIRFLRQLTGHPNIIRYIQAAQLNPQESGHGRAEFLLLTELCSGENVVDVLLRNTFTSSHVLKIFFSACSAVQHMHSCNPPIIHRDIKIENLLFDNCGCVKLCDFGSATTEIILPNDSWSVQERTHLEEELARHTTPMYRAPELLDVYSNFPIGTQQDIWALGCILFYLCYRKHPFEDSAKLRIINANYTIPEAPTSFSIFNPLIEATLQVDPRKRPSIHHLCESVSLLATKISVDLTKPLDLQSFTNTHSAAALSNSGQNNESCNQMSERKVFGLSPRPSPSAQRKFESESNTHQQASAMLGAIKDQGMAWFKNIKEKTTSVAQVVQSTYGGRGPDMTALTSRLIIAPSFDGIHETLLLQLEEIMCQHILEETKGKLMIYNLSARRLRCNYGTIPAEVPLIPVGSGLVPTIDSILEICGNAAAYLSQNNSSSVVFTGAEAHCVLLSVALILYTRLTNRPLSALELICSKRLPPNLLPSYHRQLDLIAKIVATEPEDLNLLVHNREVQLHSLLVSPLPLFNRNRTGCRPVIDVFVRGSKIWSSHRNYEELRSFELSDCNMLDLDLGNQIVSGDVQIFVYHFRWLKMQNRVQHHLMFSISFHTNFIDPLKHMLEFNRGDLDHQVDDDSKFCEPLRIGLKLKIDDLDLGFNPNELPIFMSYEKSRVLPTLLVSGEEEYFSIMRCLGNTTKIHSSDMENSITDRTKPPRPLPPTRSDKRTGRNDDDFFSTLSWNNTADHIQSSDSDETQNPPNTNENSSQLNVSSIIIIDDSDQRDDLYIKTDESEKLFELVDDDLTETPNFVGNSGTADLLGLESDFDFLSIQSSSSGIAQKEAEDCPNILAHKTMSEIPQICSVIDENESHKDSLPDKLVDLAPQKRNLFVPSDNMGGIQRIVSAPSFATDSDNQREKFPDPFADFMASTSRKNMKMDNKTNNSKFSTKPSNFQRPNYSRSHFDVLNSIGGAKKPDKDAFNDLLSSHGFNSSTRSVKSLGEMKRQTEVQDMDPVNIKIRDWTYGKERNIRALLGSLNDVLWKGAEKWMQPSMGDLLTHAQVKKFYRKACLVVHPDKQTGTENEALARAIFTELNDAWTAFEAMNSSI